LILIGIMQESVVTGKTQATFNASILILLNN
jgi:hypothetical protein